MQSLSQLNLKIGPYEVHAIPTGLFGLDGGAMFGTVPKILWSKTNPADEQNRIPMEARALLLKSTDRCILVDTGNGSDFVAKHGEKLGSKFAEIYSVEQSETNLFSSLKKHGIEANDVTDVILTHLHFDHAGGATQEINGKIVATFPNAKYYVQSSNLKNAQNPNIREKASYLKPNFIPLIESQQLILIDGPMTDYLPHISLWVSNGHTEGQQVVIVADDKNQLIYCGDVIATSSHIKLPWVMGYDINPLLVIEDKSYVLSLSDQKQTYYFFEHDPYCDMASVEKSSNNEYILKERFKLC